MPVDINYDQDDSTEDSDDSASTSEVTLWMAENPVASERDPTPNHDSDAYELLTSGGDLYKAFTRKQGRKNVWSRSDTASHIIAALQQWTEVLPDDPEVYIKYHNKLVDAFEQSAGDEGNDMDALELFGPSESQMAAFVANSDKHSIDDLQKAVDEVYEQLEDDE